MKDLFIPQGIKMEKELFEGFTKQEIPNVIFGVIVSSIAGIFMYMYGMPDVQIFIRMTFIIGVSVAVSIREPTTNLCMVDYVKTLYKFQIKQKRFIYDEFR